MPISIKEVENKDRQHDVGVDHTLCTQENLLRLVLFVGDYLGLTTARPEHRMLRINDFDGPVRDIILCFRSEHDRRDFVKLWSRASHAVRSWVASVCYIVFTTGVTIQDAMESGCVKREGHTRREHWVNPHRLLVALESRGTRVFCPVREPIESAWFAPLSEGVVDRRVIQELLASLWRRLPAAQGITLREITHHLQTHTRTLLSAQSSQNIIEAAVLEQRRVHEDENAVDELPTMTRESREVPCIRPRAVRLSPSSSRAEPPNQSGSSHRQSSSRRSHPHDERRRREGQSTARADFDLYEALIAECDPPPAVRGTPNSPRGGRFRTVGVRDGSRRFETSSREQRWLSPPRAARRRGGLQASRRHGGRCEYVTRAEAFMMEQGPPTPASTADRAAAAESALPPDPRPVAHSPTEVMAHREATTLAFNHDVGREVAPYTPIRDPRARPSAGEFAPPRRRKRRMQQPSDVHGAPQRPRGDAASSMYEHVQHVGTPHEGRRPAHAGRATSAPPPAEDGEITAAEGAAATSSAAAHTAEAAVEVEHFAQDQRSMTLPEHLEMVPQESHSASRSPSLQNYLYLRVGTLRQTVSMMIDTGCNMTGMTTVDGYFELLHLGAVRVQLRAYRQHRQMHGSASSRHLLGWCIVEVGFDDDDPTFNGLIKLEVATNASVGDAIAMIGHPTLAWWSAVMHVDFHERWLDLLTPLTINQPWERPPPQWRGERVSRPENCRQVMTRNRAIRLALRPVPHTCTQVVHWRDVFKAVWLTHDALETEPCNFDHDVGDQHGDLHDSHQGRAHSTNAEPLWMPQVFLMESEDHTAAAVSRADSAAHSAATEGQHEATICKVKTTSRLVLHPGGSHICDCTLVPVRPLTDEERDWWWLMVVEHSAVPLEETELAEHGGCYVDTLPEHVVLNERVTNRVEVVSLAPSTLPDGEESARVMRERRLTVKLMVCNRAGQGRVLDADTPLGMVRLVPPQHVAPLAKHVASDCNMTCAMDFDEDSDSWQQAASFIIEQHALTRSTLPLEAQLNTTEPITRTRAVSPGGDQEAHVVRGEPRREERCLDIAPLMREPSEHSTPLQLIENASLEDISDAAASSRLRVDSVDPSIFDDAELVPVIVLYAGVGGISLGTRHRVGSRRYVTVLAIEGDAFFADSHRLTHPHIPVSCTWMVGHDETLSIIESFLPRRLWSRAWVHASPSCRQASSINLKTRDVDQSRAQTLWALQLLQKLRPAVWTLEQAPSLYQSFRGQYRFVSRLNMRLHCKLPQDRRRLIMSNAPLSLPTRGDAQAAPLTVRDALARVRGWSPGTRLLMRNSMRHMKTVDCPAFTMTSGSHQVGATRQGDFAAEHQLSAYERAILQGVKRPERRLVFPPGATEQPMRTAVCNMVPPPFAAVLQKAVDSTYPRQANVSRMARVLASTSPRAPTTTPPAERVLLAHKHRWAAARVVSVIDNSRMMLQLDGRTGSLIQPRAWCRSFDPGLVGSRVTPTQLREAGAVQLAEHVAPSFAEVEQRAMAAIGASVEEITRPGATAAAVSSLDSTAAQKAPSEEEQPDVRERARGHELHHELEGYGDNADTLREAKPSPQQRLLVLEQQFRPKVEVQEQIDLMTLEELDRRVESRLLSKLRESEVATIEVRVLYKPENDSNGWYTVFEEERHRLPGGRMREGEQPLETAVYLLLQQTGVRAFAADTYIVARENELNRLHEHFTYVCLVGTGVVVRPRSSMVSVGRVPQCDVHSTDWAEPRSHVWINQACKLVNKMREGLAGFQHSRGAHVAPTSRSNVLEKTDPARFGPYLEDGEEYQMHRTTENVDKVLEQCGGEAILKEHGADTLQHVRELIYEHWLLFDEKFRAVRAADVDIDVFDTVQPIRVPPHRLGHNPDKVAAAKKLVEEMVQEGSLSPIQSEWAFPAVVVPKPKGGYRLCCDLRKLNAVVPPDHYEPPAIEDCLGFLQGRRFRSTSDLRSGFHQLKLSPRAQRVFTIVLPFGTFAYQRLPMGFINATAEFQRCMNTTLAGSLWSHAMIMVDDLLVASSSLEDHLAHLRVVFAKLAARGHSLSAKKTFILQPEVEYLGHISTPDGFRMADRTVQAVRDMPYPLNDDGTINVTRVRSFLGMINWVLRYLKPIQEISGTNLGAVKAVLTRLTETTTTPPPQWDTAAMQAWDQIREAVAADGGIHHVDYNKPLRLRTDACATGLGGYLFQLAPPSRSELVNGYWSRATTRDERKWETRELETLAIICALEHFHHFVDGRRIMLETDHRNILWLGKVPLNGGRLARWAIRLSAYRLNVAYRPGEQMPVADALSRNALPLDEHHDALTSDVVGESALDPTHVNAFLQEVLWELDQQEQPFSPEVRLCCTVARVDGGGEDTSTSRSREYDVELHALDIEDSHAALDSVHSSSSPFELTASALQARGSHPACQEVRAGDGGRHLKRRDGSCDDDYDASTDSGEVDTSRPDTPLKPPPARRNSLLTDADGSPQEVRVMSSEPRRIRKIRSHLWGISADLRVAARETGVIFQHVVMTLTTLSCNTTESTAHNNRRDGTADWKYTEAWTVRASGRKSKIEQNGTDSLIVPREWFKTAGQFRVLTRAWFVRDVGVGRLVELGMMPGDGVHPRGRLHGMDGLIAIPDGTVVLNRAINVSWEAGDEPVFESRSAHSRERVGLEHDTSIVPLHEDGSVMLEFLKTAAAGDVSVVMERAMQPTGTVDAKEHRQLTQIIGREEACLQADDITSADDGALSRAEAHAAYAPPPGIAPRPITWDELIAEQMRDEEIAKIVAELPSATDGKSLHYHMIDGVLHFSHEVLQHDLERDNSRPVLPFSLRKRAFDNHHTSVYGSHLGIRGTQRAISTRYYYSHMKEDIQSRVRGCQLCALAKTTRPTRQGLLRSRVYAGPLDCIGMDIMGPLITAAEERYLWVAWDPFSHRLWLRPLRVLNADNVVDSFVHAILLQWGAPRSIVTDGGTEFRNEHLAKAMEKLRVHHQFTPPYHPSSNFTERVNRFIGCTLRALVNSDFASQEDWGRLVPYVEFAYNQLHIPGTHLSPFMLTTGRQPLLPTDLQLLPSQSLDRSRLVHADDLEKRLLEAQAEVQIAHNKARAENAESFNQDRQHQEFDPGDVVLYYHVERQEGQASKLLMRNQIYKVIERVDDSNLYRLSLVAKPTRVTTAHVDQLTLYVGHLESAEDGDEVGESQQTLDDLRVNQYVVFVLRGEPPSHLRVAEVVEIEEGTLSAQLWHNIDSARTARLDPTKPLANRRLAPEWAHKRSGESLAGTPKSQQIASYDRLVTTYRIEGSNPDITVVVPAFNMQSGGKVPENICRTSELWRAAREAEADEGSSHVAESPRTYISADDRLIVARPGQPAFSAILLGQVRGDPRTTQTIEVLAAGRRTRINSAHARKYDATLVGKIVDKSRDGVEQPRTRNPGRQDTAAVSDGPTAVAAARSHSDGSGVVGEHDPRPKAAGQFRGC